MDIPMQIVERYKSFRKDNHLFNIGNLDSINKRIKKVAAANSTSKCKITKCFCKSTPLVLRNSISFLVSH